jgi:hypothetical protein
VFDLPDQKAKLVCKYPVEVPALVPIELHHVILSHAVTHASASALVLKTIFFSVVNDPA